MATMAAQPKLVGEDGLLEHHDESPSEAPNKTAALQGSQDTGSEKSADATQGQAVRFSSNLQEIEPIHSIHPTSTTDTLDQEITNSSLSPEARTEIHNLSLGLQNSHIQQHRMTNFAYEPISLPASRVPSNDTSSRHASIVSNRRQSTSMSSVYSPPLTPSGSASREENRKSSALGEGAGTGASQKASMQVTPQTSGPRQTPVPVSMETPMDSRVSLVPDSTPTSPMSQGPALFSPKAVQDARHGDKPLKHPPLFSSGPENESYPPSQEQSPISTPRLGSGTQTPPTQFTRPFTPAGEADDPYARSKRPPQSRNLDSIDARFKFSGKEVRRHSGMGFAAAAMGSLPRSNSDKDLKSQEKHHPGFALHGPKKDHLGVSHDESSVSLGSKHSSMADLKRFLRIGSSTHKKSHSPSRSILGGRSGTQTPTQPGPPPHVPFADDHGLQSKYGKFGKVLGSGAGGSVRLMKRSTDGVTFAVKQFRDKHSYETEREYAKKVTAEFCIGSTLHHGNIIETLDIIHERGHWYEVMEYAPFDLFAIVMTGKMSREEVACSFLQIVAGVTYLHGMGLAHRDLKLDNVVVNDRGIMKIIDFGSAIVYKYPFENDIVLASGVVGSDPYLAPEVYDNNKYDPQPTDVWSLAIIFACMSLRRFPWKAPRISDNSFKLFIAAPTPGTPSLENNGRRASDHQSKSATDLPSTGIVPRHKSEGGSHHPHSHSHSRHPNGDKSSPELSSTAAQPESSNPATRVTTTDPSARTDAPKPESIRGPWRLLRLLPRETRSIMGRMLDLDPKHRATIEEMLEDPWISRTLVCTQVDAGLVIKAPGHEHTLEPGTPDPPAP